MNFSIYLDVALENHVTRDGRKAIDNVDDEVERELKKVSRKRTSSNPSSKD